MACTIHPYVEFRKKGTPQWWGYSGRINLERDYELFELMGNDEELRNQDKQHPMIKGIPDDLGRYAMKDWYLSIDEEESEHSTTKEKAKMFHEDYDCPYLYLENGQPLFVKDPDWHTASWLSTSEFEKILKKYKAAEVYMATLALMKTFESLGNDVRLVYWFDN